MKKLYSRPARALVRLGGEPAGPGFDKGGKLKMLYLRDYLELGGQPVHRYVSVHLPAALGSDCGTLRSVLAPLDQKYNFFPYI